MRDIRHLLLIFAILLTLLASPVYAADWPQWRFDAQRTGATAAQGPADAKRLWSLNFGQPDPAYDHQFRMCADITYAPIAAEGLVFVPSNVEDCVTTYDLRDGTQRWRFFTEGPVRFAPVYYNGNLYFGSDDGRLYCVVAKTGELQWEIRGVPNDTPDARMLVNGRMVSRWPLRGAPVEKDGIIYFGTGIWPEEGAYVCAVNATDGRLVWRSDSLSFVKNGMSDHDRPYNLSLPPHGYLAFIDGHLAVPSGRSLAAWLDPNTGAMEPYTCFYAKTNPPRGTWYVSGIREFAIQGGNWFGTCADAAPLPEALQDATLALYWSKQFPENEQYVVKNRPFLRADTYTVHSETYYTEPVLTDTTLYQSEFNTDAQYLIYRGKTHVKRRVYDRIVARDVTHPEWTTVEMKHYAYDKGKSLESPRLEFPVLWTMDSPLKVLAEAGDMLYAGGENTVAGIRADRPEIAWQATVDGYPLNALIADNRLVIATDTGAIYCFGDNASGEHATATVSPSDPPEKEHTTPEGGYALVLGWGDGAAARALAENESRHVVVIEPDASIATQARQTLTDAGLYGRRIHLINAQFADLELSAMWAERVRIDPVYACDEQTLREALQMLRPYTGQLTLSKAAPHAATVTAIARTLSGYSCHQEENNLIVQRTMPPDGAEDWTHEMAGADNRAASSDTLAWPLGVLWYSGDIDRFFTPATHFQHERNPHALVSHGRMFLLTGHILHCTDIYTGRYLWRKELPLTPWLRTMYFDSRQSGRATERTYVAAADRVYVVTGSEIRAYDAATGADAGVFNIPEMLRMYLYAGDDAPETRPYFGFGRPVGWQPDDYKIQTAPEWTDVHLHDDLILAMVGPHLVAVDRCSGKVKWTRITTKEATTFAVGDNKLYGLDFCLPPNVRRGMREADTSALLFALDPATGDVLWERAAPLGPTKGSYMLLSRPWNVPSMAKLMVNQTHNLLLLNVDTNRVHAFKLADGTDVWSREYPSSGYQRGHMVVTEDQLLLSGAYNYGGVLLDIQTGDIVGDDTAICLPRTCGQFIGNSNLIAYRDAATELYDVKGNRTIGFYSVRSGCTTSFFPADGVMNAPMLAHGCVCNYPMFSSLALYHAPWLEQHRPAIVTESWENEVSARPAYTALTTLAQ